MDDGSPRFLDVVVEWIARAMDALGLNGTRLRWRWNQRRRDLGEAGLRAEMVVRSARVAYKMCPACRALVPRGARACTECGAHLSSVRAPGLTRAIANLIPGATASTVLILLANFVFFALVVLVPVVAPGRDPGSPLGRLFSFDAITEIRYGSGFTPLTVQLHEWWRIITPIFLHAGLLHFAMNSYALVALGPLVEEEFGTERLAVIYIATGIAGSAASQLLRTVNTVGASGALSGLLGLLLVHGYRIGGAYGNRLRSVMGQNALIMAAMSFIPGIDWINHAGGFAMGCALGALTPSGPFRSRATEAIWVALAWGVMAVVLGAFWMMARHGMADAVMVQGAFQRG